MTAFVIAVLVFFVLNLALTLISMMFNINEGGSGTAIIAGGINVLVSLGFITWSIILLAS